MKPVNRLRSLQTDRREWLVEWKERFLRSSDSISAAEILEELELLFPGNAELRARKLLSNHPDDETTETRLAVRRAILALVSKGGLEAKEALSYLHAAAIRQFMRDEE